jgi:fibronectin type 3 domain-containing protein
MPRSSKAPEPPPEPDYNELVQNDVARIKRLLGLDVNRLALGSEVEGIVLNPVSGSRDYTIPGVSVIEFVNVSTSMAPAQTGSGYPAQVTGLNITPQTGSDTQLNLTWTANTAPDFSFYNVYRGPTGFTPGPSFIIAQPTTNSYANTGLVPGTAYYYSVSAINSALLEGASSLEVSGTTNNLIAPPQVVGLTVTVVSNSELDLTWTASTASDINHYDVHRSTTSGFTPATGNRISQPVTNSYNNTTGLSASTTYYYKVAAVDNAGNIGTYSTQASGTTLAPPAVTPSFLLHLNGDFTDSSTNALVPDAVLNGNGFGAPGKFGSNYWKIDTPTHWPGGNVDHIRFNGPLPAPIQMDTTTGFSYSFWINPVDISALLQRRVILEGGIDANNIWTIQIDSAGIVYFFVKKAGTSIRRQVTGATTGSWHHIAAVYDAVANTVKLYRNAVEGASSSAAVEYPGAGSDNDWRCGTRGGTVDAYYTGYIDEIQYFKGVVLTPTQITSLMNINTT